MPIQGDLVYGPTPWPNNTTPVALDGTGSTPENFTGYELLNAAASARYVRLFDKASAPTMGTDTPKIVIPLKAGESVHFVYPRPPLFNSGLWVSVTTGIANADNAAPSANDVLMTLYYSK